MVKYLLVIVFFLGFSAQSQEVFNLDFENEKAPQDWVFSEKSEWGHLIGEDGSNYFRFHPYSNTDVLETPTINLSSGVYVLYFSWNETGDTNPNFVNVRIRKNNENWQEVYDFGGSIEGATNRVWQRDSVVIGDLDASNYTIQFEYKSDGKFPSQYIGLDNVSLEKSDEITSLVSVLEKVKFEVYPNPVSTTLNFTVEDLAQRNFDFYLYSSDGRLIKKQNQISNGTHTIDVSQLPKGIYILELEHEEGIKTEQLIIQ